MQKVDEGRPVPAAPKPKVLSEENLEALCLLAPVDWCAAAENLREHVGEGGMQQVVRRLLQTAVIATRLAEYMDWRANGAGHADAVKAQNKKAAKVRKALGYAWPKDDLRF